MRYCDYYSSITLQQPAARNHCAISDALVSDLSTASRAAAAAAGQVRAAGSSDEPYIAAIVSPYNKRLPGLQSSVTWFRVEGGGKAGGNMLEQVRAALTLRHQLL
jgi:hypothetical protein